MFTLTIHPEGGQSFELTATTRDVLQWEKTSKGRTLKNLQEDYSLTDFYKIAHFAALRECVFTGGLSEFEAWCDIDIDDGDDEDGNPTSEGR